MHTFVAYVNLSCSAYIFSTNYDGLANHHSRKLKCFTWANVNTHTFTYSLQALVNIHWIEKIKRTKQITFYEKQEAQAACEE